MGTSFSLRRVFLSKAMSACAQKLNQSPMGKKVHVCPLRKVPADLLQLGFRLSFSYQPRRHFVTALACTSCPESLPHPPSPAKAAHCRSIGYFPFGILVPTRPSQPRGICVGWGNLNGQTKQENCFQVPQPQQKGRRILLRSPFSTAGSGVGQQNCLSLPAPPCSVSREMPGW